MHRPSGRTFSAWGGRTRASKVWGPIESSPAADVTNQYGSWRKILRVGGLSSAGTVRGDGTIGRGARPPSDPLVVDGDGGRVGSPAHDINAPDSCRKILRTGGLSSAGSIRRGGPIRVDAPSPLDPAAVGGYIRGRGSLFPLESAMTTGGPASVPSFGNGDRAFFLGFAGGNNSSPAVPNSSHGVEGITPASDESAADGGARSAPPSTKKQ